MSENKVDLKSTSQYYLYPMANSVNGGEDHSEYNVVKSLGNIVFYSAATRETDFIETSVTYISDSVDDDYRPRFSITTNGGMANCNGYFVKCQPIENLDLYLTVETAAGLSYISDFKRYLDEYIKVTELDETISGTLTLTYDLYLSINYGDTLATGMSFKMLVSKSSLSSSSSDYNLPEDFKYDLQELYETSYEPLGFSDIGLYLGSIDLHTEIENNAFKNINITKILSIKNSNFLLSDHLMRGIDINRLGSSQYNFYKTLATQLEELYKLNVYGGNLYVSYRNKKDDTRQDQINDFGGDYRLQIDSKFSNDSDEQVTNFNLAKFNDSTTNEEIVAFKNLIKFIGKINNNNYDNIIIQIGNDATETIIENVKELKTNIVEIEEILKTNSISTKSGDDIVFNDKNLKDINTINATKVYGAVWN